MTKIHKEIIQNTGLKVTQARIQVLEILNKTPKHFCAESVYNILKQEEKNISLATVYRILMQFHEKKLIKKHHFHEKTAYYELLDTPHHDHMINIENGEIIEFEEEEIEKLQQEVAKKFGFELVDHELILYVRPNQKN